MVYPILFCFLVDFVLSKDICNNNVVLRDLDSFKLSQIVNKNLSLDYQPYIDLFSSINANKDTFEKIVTSYTKFDTFTAEEPANTYKFDSTRNVYNISAKSAKPFTTAAMIVTPPTGETMLNGRSPETIDREQQAIRDNYGLRIRVEKMEKPCENLKKEIDELKRRNDEQRWASNMAHARSREDHDFTSNQKKENKIVVTGLSGKSKVPDEKVERLEWIKALVKNLANAASEGAGDTIIFVKQLTSNAEDLPVAEITFDSVKTAMEVRQGFAQMKFDGVDFRKIFMANQVTLATRVRVEILMAIARQYATEEEVMFVKQFTSRPVLIIKGNGTTEEKAFTFADAISKFGQNMEMDNLRFAYWKSGRAFEGQLEQTFVIMSEEGRSAWRSRDENGEFRSQFGSGMKPAWRGGGRGGRGNGRGRFPWRRP